MSDWKPPANGVWPVPPRVTPEDPDREACWACGLWTFKDGQNIDRAQIAALAGAKETAPIRCIQRGRATIQGRVIGKVVRLCVRYEGGEPVMADFGKIAVLGGVVFGRLL